MRLGVFFAENLQNQQGAKVLRSLFNLKDMHPIAFRYKLHYTLQSKTSRRIMAASAGNIPRLIQTIIMSHTKCTQPCNNIDFTFQLMIIGLLNTAGFQNLKYQEQGIFSIWKYFCIPQF